MTTSDDTPQAEISGDLLLLTLSALANSHRLRIIAVLMGGRQYVSQLAREIHMSRPLLHMHLQRLEAAGLIEGTLELSDEGKAMKYYQVSPFEICLTPGLVQRAAQSLPTTEGTPE
jgi:predicted transcriptional regulator